MRRLLSLSTRLLCLALAGWCLLAAPAAKADNAWTIVKYGNGEYLTLRNVAQFYHLQYTRPEGRAVVLQAPGTTIKGELGSKELIINGIKVIMIAELVEKDGDILLSRLDLTKLVEPILRPNSIHGANAIRTVVIDPGHGGYDHGATSIYGNEKDFALDVGLRLRALLQKRGLNVQMTRSDDTFVPLEERAAFSNRFRDGIFVAIHFNAGSDFGTGIETYTLAPRYVPSTGDDSPSASCMVQCAGNVEDPENMALATAMHASLLSRLPMVDRGIKRARFCVLRLATIPAVLVEGGFVSNPAEAARIAVPAYRQAEAEAIALAIQNYRSAINVGSSMDPIMAGPNNAHPSLSITPGSVGMQNGIPTIGASAPIDPARISNIGPTVVVPHSGPSGN